MSAGRQGPSGSSTGSTRARALALIRRILEGFGSHPYFFIVRASGRASPPVEPYTHQVELLFRIAFRRPVRILVGDEIGLGKTVEAILAARMLVERDHVSKVLILVPRILVNQWISELLRFGVRATELTRDNIEAKAREGFPDGWYIASIDLAKKDRYRGLIAGGNWDIVIVDEAHRVGLVRRKREKNQRYIFVEELSKKTDRSLILLSATPHRGFADDYMARLKLLDPYLTDSKELDNPEFYRLTRGSIVFRRGKQDVNEVYEQREIFKKARLVARVVIASDDEAQFDRELTSFLREKLLDYYEMVGEEQGALPLLLALIVKRASSSPYAALETLERILKKRGSAPSQGGLDSDAASIAEKYLGIGFEEYGEDDEDQEPDEAVNEFAQRCSTLLDDRDVERLKRIYGLAERIAREGDSRLRSAISIIREHLERGEKVVLFTEYRDTAIYIYKRIKEDPSIAGRAVLITSREVMAPGWRGDRRPDIEDVKKLLASGEISLIVSTDVASEGLNLQVANILIHYEPLWSPVKVEQRLGRVWRLGQERDVAAYTIFLSRESDRDILEVIYKKLIALGRALSLTRSAVGEEVVIDMGGEGYSSIPIEAGPGSGERYSEYRAIIRYIAGGRESLEEYINSIVNTLKVLKEQLSILGLSAATSKERVDGLFRDIGGLRGVDGYMSLKEIFRASAMLAGFAVYERDNTVYAGGYVAKSHSDLYSYAEHIAENYGDNAGDDLYLVSSHQCGVRELHLYKVSVAIEGKSVYSESVGVAIYDSEEKKKVVRGAELLKLVADSLSPEHLVSAANEYEPSEAHKHLGERAKRGAKDAIWRAGSEIIDYMDKTERLGFANKHVEWVPRSIEQYQITSTYLGSIVYAGGRGGAGGAPPPAYVKEIEEAAMRAAMEYERRCGRIPEDVSMREHYDILSRDPRNGEVRYIEVKGRSGFDLEVELTEEEFKLAGKLGERYWLYIVYGIGSGSPRILSIRDPARSIEWREEVARRYRARLGD